MGNPEAGPGVLIATNRNSRGLSLAPRAQRTPAVAPPEPTPSAGPDDKMYTVLSTPSTASWRSDPRWESRASS